MLGLGTLVRKLSWRDEYSQNVHRVPCPAFVLLGASPRLALCAMMSARLVGYRDFTDGIRRAVYAERDGR